MIRALLRSGSASARAQLGLVLVLASLLGGALPAAAQPPLFSFVQISDSQPNSELQWTYFEQVLDTIVASGSQGALLPQPVDFVLFAGDLVSHGNNPSEWIRLVDTIDARLTANAIPYRAVPGNHDQQGNGPTFDYYEFYVADSGVWDTDSATVYGQNGPIVQTGWSGLRIIGFNNSYGGDNVISPGDLAAIQTRVTAAAAANENVMLVGHHPHDDQGRLPLAGLIENPSICCYAHGHSGSPSAKRGLDLVANPNIWKLNTNSIAQDAALLYYEAYPSELRVYVIQLVLNPTALPVAKVVPLPHPLNPLIVTAPTAEFSATPLSGPAALAVSFSDLSTGTPTGWLWSFGDGATSTAEHPTHTYAAPGVYDVSLTASNSAGSNTKLRAGYVSVTPPPPTQTFLPSADGRVKSSAPAANFGMDPELRVRGGDPIYRSYLRFDPIGLAGSSVLSAKLRIFATGASSSGGALYQVASNWTESGLTWSSAPAIGGAPIAGPVPIADNQWREIDVTSVVRGDGAYAFALDSVATNSGYYSSREGANPPQLVVQTSPSAVPMADFAAAPTSGQAPLAVNFTDLSTGAPTSWLWTFGDGQTSTSRNPSHTYASAGVYDVALRATNASGSNTFTRPGFVQVGGPVPPVADFSGSPLSGMGPLLVSFTDLSSGAPTSWLWTFGDGQSSTLRNPSHSYAAPGVYDVRLSVTNAAGSNERLRVGYVSVAPPPPAQTFLPAADARVSSGSPNGNYGSETELRARGGATPHQSYLRFDLSSLTGVSIPSATLRLYVTDASNSGGSAYPVSSAWSESQISWTNAPAISGAPIAGLGSVLAGQWVELDVTGGVSGGGDVSFALASASADSVYYSSREGANPAQLVVATGPPVTPTADFNGGPQQGPAPLSVAFQDYSTGGPATWFWSFGDGASSTLRSPVHVYTAPGSYSVSLSVANVAGSHSLTRPAFVDVGPPLPIATFAPTADAKVSLENPAVNYGAEPNLRLKLTSSANWRSFLRFDVAGLTRAVARARLRLYVDDQSSDGGAVHLVSGAWSEGSVDWNTAPALGPTPIGSFGAVATGVWVELDVTSAVAGNGSYSFGLGSASSDSAYYGSRESAHPPQLLIEMVP